VIFYFLAKFAGRGLVHLFEFMSPGSHLVIYTNSIREPKQFVNDLAPVWIRMSEAWESVNFTLEIL